MATPRPHAPRRPPRPPSRSRFNLLGLVVLAYVVSWGVVAVILASRDRMEPEFYMTFPMGIGAIVSVYRPRDDNADRNRDSNREDR